MEATAKQDEMYKKINKFILANLMLCLALLVGAQTKNSYADSKPVDLSFYNGEFSGIQKLLNEQAARGYQVSDVSYHSKLKNLYTKGQLKISLKTADSKMKYEYLALTTERHSSILQREMNDAGEKGFRLLRQTPIPLETGFIREQDAFITIMEKSNEPSKIYHYIVLSYHFRSYEQKRIKQAMNDGYSKVNDSQIGQITYLIMEKAIR